MDNNFSESKPNLSRAPQETELGSVPVSQWPSPYKKQVRNLEFQLTSVSRGGHGLLWSRTALLGPSHQLAVRMRIMRIIVSRMRIRTCARALALSSALPHAGNWLNGIPSSTLGLHLQDQEFRYCLRYWLGVPLHSSPYSCPECHNTADPFGDHQVGCGCNGDRITRHNAICDVVFSAAQSAALAPSKEMPNLIPDSLSRPADVFLPTWSRGRPAALDVHVISPLQQQTMGDAASTPGHALQVGVQRKLASHLSACRSVGVEFIPFVMETLGGLAEDSIFILRSLGKAITSSSTELLSPCGGGMPSNGFTASQLSLPQWTALFNSSLFPLLTSYIVYIIYKLYIYLIFISAALL